MIVDRRKDNYDELLLLSRDARASRTRTNYWTTGLIATAMVASGVYVTATNQKVDELANDAHDAQDQLKELRVENARLLAERNAFKVERDIYRDTYDRYAEIAPSLKLGDQIANLAGRLGAANGTTTVSAAPELALADIVWVVDGSRRFPMAENDLLWIPEAHVWIKLDSPTNNGNVTIFRDRDSTQRPAGEDASGANENLPLQLVVEGPGNSNYACLSLIKPSTRSGFGVGYADLEILFQSQECPSSFRRIP